MPAPRAAPSTKQFPARPQASNEESVEFLGQVSSGYSLSQLVFPKPDPSLDAPKCDVSAGGKGCATQQPNTLLFSTIAGFRSKNVEKFFFISYYKYSLFWDLELSKASGPGDFFQSPKSKKSPMPTRGLLRVHEWITDVRYLHEHFRIGSQFQLALGRQNSSLFAQEGEESRNYFASEMFLPYVIFLYQNLWRTRLYFPIYTVVNYDDSTYTSTTMSLSAKGRGFVYSGGLNNSFFLPPAWLVTGLDMSFIDYKYRAVGNDKVRYGVGSRFNFAPPFFYGGWLEPRFSFYREKFYVPTASIPGYPENETTIEKAVAINRTDDTMRAGARFGYDFLGSHRIDSEVFIESKKSNVFTYSSERKGFTVNYRWVFPSLGQVMRFVKNTERDPANGVFEGEGG